MKWANGGLWVPFKGEAHIYPNISNEMRAAMTPTVAAALAKLSDELAPAAERRTNRLGLKPYEANPKTALDALHQMCEFIDRFGLWGDYIRMNFAADLLEPWCFQLAVRTYGLGMPLYHAELAWLLARLGPLDRMSDMPIERVPGASLPTSVNLLSYHRDIGIFASTFKKVHSQRSTPEDHRILALNIQSDWANKPGGVAVLPVFRDLGIAYDGAPTSLRAYLWEYLLQQLGNTGSDVCRYCGNQFELPTGRGRPPRFCVEHRAPKFQQRARRGTAPSMRSAKEAEIDSFDR